MKNYVQPGHTLTLIAPGGGVASGTPYQIGQIFGVATVTAAAGAEFAAMVEGVFDLPKVSAQAWTPGAVVYWDAGAGLATTVAGGKIRIGAAVLAAANPSGTGRVRLNGVAQPNEA
jgi:predicted RecA/RadA family phage recombinase